VSNGWEGDARYVVVPPWLVTLVFAALPLAWVAIARPWRWLCSKLGDCPSCGYDLRATPGRCPECGTITP